MIAYVVRCDVCGAEAFVPLNQDPDMCMSARGWRMRPHSKMCPDCVFALEGPKIPPSRINREFARVIREAKHARVV